MAKKQKPKPKRWLLKLIIIILMALLLLILIAPLISVSASSNQDLIAFVNFWTEVRNHLAEYYGLYGVLLAMSSALIAYYFKLGGKHK